VPIELPADLPNRKQLRLASFDYAAPGAYFVTICTDDRRCVLGTVDGEGVLLSPMGEIVRELWRMVPATSPGVAQDEFVVMPNHLHGIVILAEGAPSLPQVIGRFKSLSTRRIRALPGEAQTRLWQRSCHEHVIRDDHSLSRIREYVANNPLKWHLDRENPINVARASRRAGQGAGPYE
jgi:REP element-mobilizing transposase RayT